MNGQKQRNLRTDMVGMDPGFISTSFLDDSRYTGVSLIRGMAEEGNPGGKVPSLMDLHEKCLPLGGKVQYFR
jgi:hypothetical protein